MASQIGFSAKMTITVGSGSPTAVSGLKSITVPGFEVEQIESTYLNQSTPFRSYINGMTKFKSVEVEVQYSKTNFDTIAGYNNVNNLTFIITGPDEDTSLGTLTCDSFTITGNLYDLEAPTFDVDKLATFKFKIQPNSMTIGTGT